MLNRVGLSVLLSLTPVAAFAQQINCMTYPGGLTRCSEPQGGPLPTPLLNCDTFNGGLTRCSQPQTLPVLRTPPPETYPIPMVSQPYPNMGLQYLQQQREQEYRRSQELARMRQELEQEDYERQELQLQRQELQLEEAQSSHANSVPTIANPSSEPASPSVAAGSDAGESNERDLLEIAEFCAGYETAKLKGMKAQASFDSFARPGTAEMEDARMVKEQTNRVSDLLLYNFAHPNIDLHTANSFYDAGVFAYGKVSALGYKTSSPCVNEFEPSCRTNAAYAEAKRLGANGCGRLSFIKHH